MKPSGFYIGSVLAVGCVIMAMMTGCSSALPSGTGKESHNDLSFEWVDTGTGKPVLCVGRETVGLDCNWEAFNR